MDKGSVVLSTLTKRGKHVVGDGGGGEEVGGGGGVRTFLACRH